MSWGRTTGMGAQHVIAMFGATFVLPPIMGLDPGNTAVDVLRRRRRCCSSIIVQNRVPSYLGTSAAFVGRRFAITGGQDGDLSEVLFARSSSRA